MFLIGCMLKPRISRFGRVQLEFRYSEGECHVILKIDDEEDVMALVEEEIEALYDFFRSVYLLDWFTSLKITAGRWKSDEKV